MSLKQLNFFTSNTLDQSSSVSVKKEQHEWHLYTDGASKNNPGPSGAGISLSKDGKPVCEQGLFLGKRTNNQAEYLALLLGLFFADEFLSSSETLHVFCDSQLLVRQMNGQYKVKDAVLKKMQALGYELIGSRSCTFSHVYREDNKRADELANRGVDKKTSLPKRFIDLLNKHDIT